VWHHPYCAVSAVKLAVWSAFERTVEIFSFCLDLHAVFVLISVVSLSALPYLTLPFRAGILSPSAETSSGPNAHPHVNPEVIETFCKPEEDAPVFLS